MALSLLSAASVAAFEFKKGLGFYLEGETIEIQSSGSCQEVNIYIGTTTPTLASAKAAAKTITDALDSFYADTDVIADVADDEYPRAAAGVALLQRSSLKIKEWLECLAHVHAFHTSSASARPTGAEKCLITASEDKSTERLQSHARTIVGLAKDMEENPRSTAQVKRIRSFEIWTSASVFNTRVGRHLTSCQNRLETLSALTNFQLHPRILRMLEGESCVESRASLSSAKLENCLLAQEGLYCTIKIPKVTVREQLHRVVSVPFMHEGKEILLKMPQQLPVVRANLALSGDASQCENRGSIYICPETFSTQPDECLEHLQGLSLKFLDSCQLIVAKPTGHPLVVALPQGVLISERGSTALIPELEGKAITEDPTLIVNKGILTVHHGTTSETFPGNASLENSYVLTSKYNSSTLSAILSHYRPYHNFEAMIPDDLQECIVLATLMVQAILLVPCCFATRRFYRAVCIDPPVPTVESHELMADPAACSSTAPSAPPAPCAGKKVTFNDRMQRTYRHLMQS